MILATPLNGYAQVCEFSKDAPDTFVTIDGKLYEYVPVADSKKRLAAVLNSKNLEEKVGLLEEKLRFKDALAVSYKSLIDTMLIERKTNIDLIEAEVIPEPKPTPFFERPTVNFIFGVVFTSVMFGVWKAADTGLRLESN